MAQEENSPVIYLGAIVVGIIMLLVGLWFAVLSFYMAANVKPGEVFIPGFGWYLIVLIGLAISGWGGAGMARRKYAKSTKKIRLADENAKVFRDRDSRSGVVAEMVQGDEIALGKQTEVDGVDWLEVNLPDGQTGFILGNVHIQTAMKAVIQDKQAAVYKYDSTDYPLTDVSEGAEVEVCKEHMDFYDPNTGGMPFVKVWLSDGQTGFMRRGTKFKWI